MSDVKVSSTAENSLILDDKTPSFHAKLSYKDFGLTAEMSRIQDMPDEYAIVRDKAANGGVIVYGKYNGKWVANPSCRFLVRIFLDKYLEV